MLSTDKNYQSFRERGSLRPAKSIRLLGNMVVHNNDEFYLLLHQHLLYNYANYKVGDLHRSGHPSPAAAEGKIGYLPRRAVPSGGVLQE